MNGMTGKRWSAVLASFMLMGLSLGCETLKLEREDLRGPVWTTEGESAMRQHAVEQAIDPPLEEVWVYNAQGAFGPGSALVVGDMILVNNRKGEIHAVLAETGKKRGLKEFGESVEGMPVVEGEILYVPIGQGRRSLMAYHMTRGGAIWSTRTDPIINGLLLAGDALIAADAEGWVRAYDKGTGDILWEHDFGDQRRFRATPVLVNDTAVLADDKGLVRALHVESGEVAWERDLNSPVYSTPTTNSEQVYVSSTRGRFFALDAAMGTEVWTFSAGDTTVYFGAPALSGSQVIFGSSDKHVRAFDAATGALQWETSFPDAISATPLITQNVVYIGSMGRMLYGLDRANGHLVYEQELRGRIKSAIAVREDHLVVLTEPRHVYYFKPATTDYAVTE